MEDSLGNLSRLVNDHAIILFRTMQELSLILRVPSLLLYLSCVSVSSQQVS